MNAVRCSVLLTIGLAAGCDRPTSAPRSVVTVTVTQPEPAPKAAAIPVDDRAREEQRLAGLENELQLLPSDDRLFIERARMAMAKRPPVALTDGAVQLRKLFRFFNAVDLDAYCTAYEGWDRYRRLADQLKLDPSAKGRLVLHLWQIGEPLATESACDLLGRAASDGIGSLTDAEKTFIRESGLSPYLANVKH
jgi:hypothetical protein